MSSTRKVTVTALLACLAGAPAAADGMQISPNGSRPSAKGPEANFTGSVRVDPLFAATEATRTSGSLVTFEPGARSAWHSHPAGQTLVVTSGVGWVQERNGARREIKPGDVVWTPPGVEHWHGATASTAMSHIAVTHSVGGKSVDWLEKVGEDQYGR